MGLLTLRRSQTVSSYILMNLLLMQKLLEQKLMSPQANHCPPPLLLPIKLESHKIRHPPAARIAGAVQVTGDMPRPRAPGEEAEDEPLMGGLSTPQSTWINCPCPPRNQASLRHPLAVVTHQREPDFSKRWPFLETERWLAIPTWTSRKLMAKEKL